MLTKLLCCLLLLMTLCTGKNGSSRLQIVLATRLLALHGVPCHPFIPRSFHNLAPSPDPIEYVWLRRNSELPYNVRRTKSLVLRMMQYSPPLNEARSSSKHHLNVQDKPPHEITPAALPEMGSRANDLNILQDQTPELALILFI